MDIHNINGIEEPLLAFLPSQRINHNVLLSSNPVFQFLLNDFNLSLFQAIPHLILYKCTHLFLITQLQFYALPEDTISKELKKCDYHQYFKSHKKNIRAQQF